MRMARINVYLPDELVGVARELGLNVSALTQQAIKSHAAARSTDVWLATLQGGRNAAATHAEAMAAIDEVREEAPTHHG